MAVPTATSLCPERTGGGTDTTGTPSIHDLEARIAVLVHPADVREEPGVWDAIAVITANMKTRGITKQDRLWNDKVQLVPQGKSKLPESW